MTTKGRITTRRSITLLLASSPMTVRMAALFGFARLARPVAAQDNQSGKASRGEDFDPQRDVQEDPFTEQRAYHGQIFFARIDALEREMEEPSAEGMPSMLVQHYLVTVDRVLVGTANDQISVSYYGSDEISPESGGFGPLRVGERYLLFAGFNPESGQYPVSAGTGTILIASSEQEEELARGYAPLIEAAEVREQEVRAELRAWEAARESRKGVDPTAEISPERGPPGSEIVVSGLNFGYDEVMILFGDDVAFDRVRIDDGSFRTRIVVPEDAPAGPFPLVVDDEEGFTIDLTFTVTE